jgi:competence protein ComEA
VSDFLHRHRWLVFLAASAPILAGIALLLADRLAEPRPLQIDLATVPAEDLRVYVTGAVRAPGVYPLVEGDRWIDALQAAGGPSDDADLAAVDLARRARDEDTIAVPRLGQGAAVAGATQGPLIDLNAADADELSTLPGIGEVRAAAIIASREADGPFASVDELLERDLIPVSVYEQVADLVTVGP